MNLSIFEVPIAFDMCNLKLCINKSCVYFQWTKIISSNKNTLCWISLEIDFLTSQCFKLVENGNSLRVNLPISLYERNIVKLRVCWWQKMSASTLEDNHRVMALKQFLFCFGVVALTGWSRSSYLFPIAIALKCIFNYQ